MNHGLEHIGALAAGRLSLLLIAASAFGALCALAAAWAARRFVRQPAPAAPPAWPDVSILKPLYGAEAQLSENIETYFHQDYPGAVQFVCGVQDPGDGAIPVVKSLIERHPGLDLQLVVNGAAHGGQPKVSNLINMAASRRATRSSSSGRQRHGGRPGLFAHVSGRAGAAGRRRGHLSLSRPA